MTETKELLKITEAMVKDDTYTDATVMKCQPRMSTIEAMPIINRICGDSLVSAESIKTREIIKIQMHMMLTLLDKIEDLELKIDSLEENKCQK